MTRPRPGIGSEILPVVMILLCLAGTWSLVVTMHHRGAAARAVRPATVLASRAPAPAAVVALLPPETPTAPQKPPPPPVDPTDQALARLLIAQTEQIVEAQVADRKAEGLESARLAAVAETERARRREALVRTQVDALTDQARRLEAELDEAALERDVLAKERDAAKASLAKARARSSYAVLPHKGPNGTWRRPIIIECHNGEATLQPNGPSFSLLELSMLLGPRSAPLVAAVAHELVRSQTVATPDGAPVVPYIFFVVRPDGIKPYYNAKNQLEPLGVSFGYELVDQNMEIDFPDLDNLDEWDSPVAPRPSRPGSNPALANAPADRPWPAPPARSAGGRGSDDPPDIFVWPARPTQEGNASRGGSPTGYGNSGGYSSGGGGGGGYGSGSGTTNGDQTGLHGLPRGGRPGVEAEGGALARGPYPPARNGLGRGGSGVDPLPPGAPGLDPDNPYDNVGAGGRTPGSPRSGGPPPLGLTSGSPGGWPGNSTGDGTNTPQQPAEGPRLIPVSPGGMPGLENPSAAASGSGRVPNANGTGGWGTVDPSQTPFPAVGGAPGSLSETPPGSGNDTRKPNPGDPPAGTGAASADPARPLRAPSAGGSSGYAQGASPPAASGGRGDPDPSGMPSQPFGGNFDPNQGAPPPLSQLARLAGMTGDPGSAGQPSTSKPQSSSGLGIPLSMPSQNGQPSSSSDDSDSGQTSSKDGMRVPRSRSDLKQPLKIDVPFEMVVACGPEGVVIHPGGYRLSAKALKGNEALLLRDLKTIVQTRRQVDPTIHPIPSIRFLVEPNGGETYRDARRQTMLSGLDWPVAIQVSDSDILDNLSPEGAILMRGQPPTAGAASPGSESYGKLLLNVASVLAVVLVIAGVMYTNPGPGKPAPADAREIARPTGATTPAAPAAATALPKARPMSESPPVPAVKELDRVAVAAAEAALDEASRDRARAEARLGDAQRLLAAATVEAEAAAASSRKLAYRVHDPSAQLARISQQGGFVRAERDRLKDEVAALRRAPRPKAKSIVDRNPVARPAKGDEYHFEIRHNRVTYIDLERLLKLAKADAQLRVRLSDNARVIESRVGPAGSFSMDYVYRRAALGMEDLIERRNYSFDLRGWELIPEFEGRGEPYETTRQTFSEFARLINRLSNEHATITMWVYPDGFALYRKLRDDLHARGFLVAARPLPEGMTIKGSHGGSLSAGQ